MQSDFMSLFFTASILLNVVLSFFESSWEESVCVCLKTNACAGPPACAPLHWLQEGGWVPGIFHEEGRCRCRCHCLIPALHDEHCVGVLFGLFSHQAKSRPSDHVWQNVSVLIFVRRYAPVIDCNFSSDLPRHSPSTDDVVITVCCNVPFGVGREFRFWCLPSFLSVLPSRFVVIQQCVTTMQYHSCKTVWHKRASSNCCMFCFLVEVTWQEQTSHWTVGASLPIIVARFVLCTSVYFRQCDSMR